MRRLAALLLILAPLSMAACGEPEYDDDRYDDNPPMQPYDGDGYEEDD